MMERRTLPAELEHGLNLRAFALLFGILLPAMTVVRAWTEGVPLWLGTLVILVAPAGWWALAESRFRIRVSADGIEATSWLGERRGMTWGQVEHLRIRPLVRSLVLESRPGGRSTRHGGHAHPDPEARSGRSARSGRPVTIEVSLLRKNVPLLAAELVERTGEEVWADAWRQMFGRLPDEAADPPDSGPSPDPESGPDSDSGPSPGDDSSSESPGAGDGDRHGP